MRVQALVLSLTSFVACAGLAAKAVAADAYVSPTGSGSACTQASPCREIRDGLALYGTTLGPGDTIFVADGSYLGFDVDSIDGASGAPITIQAQGSNAVVTVTNDRPDNRDTIFITFSSFIVVDGLQAFQAIRSGVRVDESPNVTIRNGVFGDNTTWGIFTDFADNLLLENNECYGTLEQHGIYVSNSGDNPIVRGNRLHDNNDAGVQLNADASQGGDGIITGALIEDNFIYENGAGGAAGINLDGVQDSIVRNNLLYDNHATGIVNYMGDGAEGPRGMEIYHNTVVQAADGRWALLFGGTTGTNTVRNNILYHPNPNKGGLLYADPSDVPNVDSDYNILDRITPDDEDTVYALSEWQAMFSRELHSRVAGALSALFVDEPNHDYHLPAGSPAVDNGLTLASVPVDIEGTPRPQGLASDIGAYERLAAGGTPSLSISDVTVTEGDAGTTTASFAVTLSAASAQAVTVSFATADGTATAGSDYVAASGSLSFAPGVTTQPVQVTVNGDTVDEPDETFLVNLSAPTSATIADGQGVGTILDDDLPPPALSIGDASLPEGNAGTTPFSFTVTLSAPASAPVTVDYATADGTATAGSDYVAQSGTLSFLPGATSASVSVLVNGDTALEPDETFTVNLTNPNGATVADGQATGTILNDDVAQAIHTELGHGSSLPADLRAEPGPAADVDLYRLSQKPHSSYEIVVDATSADVSTPASPLHLERVAADLSTLLQESVGVGDGASRSLCFENAAGEEDGEVVRVTSGGCTTSCDGSAVYRIRAYDTTYEAARFNNSGTQLTVLILANSGDTPVSGTVWYWSATGSPVASSTFSLAPRGVQAIATSAAAPGAGGSMTVSNNGRYGQLAGKAVAVEPATGFTFDTELRPRPR
jgi:parallel beta-helix repeat protein